jgi:hypothetical protein
MSVDTIIRVNMVRRVSRVSGVGEVSSVSRVIKVCRVRVLTGALHSSSKDRNYTPLCTAICAHPKSD